ncbi:MAG: L-fucose mutarotase [Solirubrobacteraceae bacterium]|nr:L-fucose mutarotase [Solirubrobacteraceae bacterium]
MLKLLDPLLNADLLYALAAMGHGDELAIVDRNFPAASTSRRLIRFDGVDTQAILRAVLTVLPLDGFVPEPIVRMKIVDDPATIPQVQRDAVALAERVEGRPLKIGALERSAFYTRAAEAFATVATGEERPYGCMLLVKGVVFPE